MYNTIVKAVRISKLNCKANEKTRRSALVTICTTVPILQTSASSLHIVFTYVLHVAVRTNSYFFSINSINWQGCIIETVSVYCEVRNAIILTI